MHLKTIAILSIGLNLAGLLGYVGKRYYFSRQNTAPNAQIAYFDLWDKSRESVLDPLPIDTSDYVFVGNSITEGFPLEEVFHSPHFKNRGISGNRSCHILHRIEGIAADHPKKIFLDVGINDILNDIPMDSLKVHYKAIVAIIRQASANSTTIIVQTVLPLGPDHKEKEPLVVEFNTWLKSYCFEQSIVCVDLFPHFLKNGGLDQSLTMDDIHINGKGYDLWKKELMAYL